MRQASDDRRGRSPGRYQPIAEVIALAEVLLSIGEPEKEDEKEAGE